MYVVQRVVFIAAVQEGDGAEGPIFANAGSSGTPRKNERKKETEERERKVRNSKTRHT
jgi:hypothetical protein